MFYQFNNIIVFICVIYILSFYQINCDNKEAISSNSSSVSNNISSIPSKPPTIVRDELETQIKSGTVKKDEAKLEENLQKFTSPLGKLGPIDPPKAKILKRPGVLEEPSEVNTTKPQSPMAEVDMALTKTILVNGTLVKSNDSDESAKHDVPIEANINATNTTKNITTPTPKPTKPRITLPRDELPEPAKPSGMKPVEQSSNMTINNDTLNMIKPSSNTTGSIVSTTAPVQSVEEEYPKVQTSKEQIPIITSKRDYIIPVVALIFAIPILLAIATVMYRRAKDYWETRHYRRMDFLIDEMYND